MVRVIQWSKETKETKEQKRNQKEMQEIKKTYTVAECVPSGGFTVIVLVAPSLVTLLLIALALLKVNSVVESVKSLRQKDKFMCLWAVLLCI